MSYIDLFDETRQLQVYNPTIYVDNAGLPTNEVSNAIVATGPKTWFIYLAFLWGAGEGPTGGERFPNFDFRLIRRRSIAEGWLDTDAVFTWNPDNGNFGVWGVRLHADGMPVVKRQKTDRDDWGLKRTASGGNGTWTLRTSVHAIGVHNQGHSEFESLQFLPGNRANRLLAEFPDINGDNAAKLL